MWIVFVICLQNSSEKTERKKIYFNTRRFSYLFVDPFVNESNLESVKILEVINWFLSFVVRQVVGGA